LIFDIRQYDIAAFQSPDNRIARDYTEAMSTGLPTARDSTSQTMALPPAMPASSAADPPLEVVFPPRRFSVAEYDQMGRAGILTEDDSVELLEGVIVEKMTKYPPHDATIDILAELLWRLLPMGWFPRVQNVFVTSDSEPEPDLVITRGRPQNYLQRHPVAGDVALIVEVAESSIHRDRRKRKIYARAGIAQYWIFDLNSGHIEMYAEPDMAAAEYQRKVIVAVATAVSFNLPEGGTVTLPLNSAFQPSEG
jgi:Uma2 family endonuclease